jgi:predicted RNA-binding Zn-ribbon protein involved in translation (DUF1610 family)
VPIKMNCPSCGKTLSAPDTAAGKKAKCPGCGQIMSVPDAVRQAEPVGTGATAQTAGPGQTSAASSPAADDQSRQPCPECGEMIVKGAAKCRFCNSILDPQFKTLLKSGTGSRGEDLKQIASYQRGVILCILVQFLAYIAYGALSRVNPIMAAIPSLVVLGAVIAGVVFAVLLAVRVYSTGAGIAMGILAIVPCLGLIMLLIINQAATKKLTENGIKVGFLGANMSQF